MSREIRFATCDESLRNIREDQICLPVVCRNDYLLRMTESQVEATERTRRSRRWRYLTDIVVLVAVTFLLDALLGAFIPVPIFRATLRGKFTRLWRCISFTSCRMRYKEVDIAYSENL